MDKNFIRTIIFLMAGILLVLFPSQILQMQNWVLNKFKIKHSYAARNNVIWGIFFIIFSGVFYLITHYIW